MATRECLTLFSKNCKVCGYLDEAEPRKFKCHSTHGNKQCPASEVQIIVVGRLGVLAKKLVQARRVRDVASELEVLQHVASRGRLFQQRFYLELDKLESSCHPAKTSA